MENRRLQAELEDMRSKLKISLDDLTADEIAAFVDCCRRIDDPYAAANAELLDVPETVCGTKLWPLTIGASVWLDEYAAKWWGGSGKGRRYFWALAYAMVHAREPEAFAAATTEAAAVRRIFATCLRFAFSVGALKRAMDRCLSPREQHGRSVADVDAATMDWSQLVARIESQSGIRREEWVWGRTARYCIRAYADLCRYAREAGAVGASRVRDELDDAINALAVLKRSIKRRIDAERAQGESEAAHE